MKAGRASGGIWASLALCLLFVLITDKGTSRAAAQEVSLAVPPLGEPQFEEVIQELDPALLEQDGNAVVTTSQEFRAAVANSSISTILLASDVQLRRDVWPDVPRELQQLSITVTRNLTITTHPVLPFPAMLDLDFMDNRVVAGSGVTILITSIVISNASRDPSRYLTVPFFQFKVGGVVHLRNTQYQIAIQPSSLGPLESYPSKVNGSARPDGYEHWPVEMQVISPDNCPINLIREAPCGEGALWVFSLSARATVFEARITEDDVVYKPVGKAALLLENVFMVAVNLDKQVPKTSDETLPLAKTVTVTDSGELLEKGLQDPNVTLIYLAKDIRINQNNFTSGMRLPINRNLTIATHLSLDSPVLVDLMFTSDAVVAGPGVAVSVRKVNFTNVSEKPTNFELIPFFVFDPGSIYYYYDVISEMAISQKVNKLTELPFILYGGQPPPGFEGTKNFVQAVTNAWCKADGRILCPDGALWIKAGVRRVEVLDLEGVDFLGNGFIVAQFMLVRAVDVSKPPPPRPAAVVGTNETNRQPFVDGSSLQIQTTNRDGGKGDGSSFSMWILVYILGGIVAIIVVVLLGILWKMRSTKREGGGKHSVESKASTHSVGEELMMEHQTVAQQLLGDVKLGALLGWGSFGRVYKGLWAGAQVAVKVILHQDGRAEFDDVEQEARFSVTLRHPNVVQTYHYATRTISLDPDVIGSGFSNPPGVTPQNAGGFNSVSKSRSGLPASAPIPEGSQESSMDVDGKYEDEAEGGIAHMNLPTNWLASHIKSRISDSATTMHSALRSWYSGSGTSGPPGITPKSSNASYGASHGMESWKETWLVQEYCELGSLGKQNILRGNRLPSAWGYGEPDLAAIVHTCMDIARGMKYLHDNNVVHGDLKCDNVLLQRSSANPRGFVAKVADFGLSRRLNLHATHMSTKSYGTITHMPPELLLSGHLSTKVDVYSFAIIMWELVAGEPPFRSLRHAEVMKTVVVDNARPKFAHGTPGDYVRLAERSWDRDPNVRPSFGGVLEELEAILLKLKPSPSKEPTMRQLQQQQPYQQQQQPPQYDQHPGSSHMSSIATQSSYRSSGQTSAYSFSIDSRSSRYPSPSVSPSPSHPRSLPAIRNNPSSHYGSRSSDYSAVPPGPREQDQRGRNKHRHQRVYREGSRE